MCVKKWYYSQMCVLANIVACLKQTSTKIGIVSSVRQVSTNIGIISQFDHTYLLLW